MRKILAFILTLSLLATSVIPTYANTGDIAAKKVLFDTAQKTMDQINNEFYSDEYLANYESTMEKLLTQLSNGTNISFDTDNTYIYDDESIGTNVTFDYNDDGKSILINFTFTGAYGEEGWTSNGSLYVDDTKIVIDFDEFSEQPIVYNFGDNLDGTELADFDMSYFKYSNIKNYINLFLDLETTGKIDAIAKDYQDNLLSYIAKADISQTNNEVTLYISDDLIDEYLLQLGTKIKNDKNIKAIYESLNIPYSYDELSTDLAEAFEAIAADVYEIKYTGVIENGVFAKNKFSFIYASNYTTTMEINFNDVANGVLADGEFLFYTDYGYEENFKTTFKVDGSGNTRTINYETMEDGVTTSKGNFKYTMNGLTTKSTGEVLMYTEPYFYVTEEPSKNPQTYEEWYNAYIEDFDDMIALYEQNLIYAEKQLAVLENSGAETVRFDTSEDEFYEFYFDTIINSDVDFNIDAVISYEDGIVLDKAATTEALNDWVVYTKDQLNAALAYKEDFKYLSAEEEYEYYLEYYNLEYEADLEEYQAYLDYIANGSPKDMIKQIIDSESTLSEEKLTLKQKQEIYENDKLLTDTAIDFAIQKSTTKNTIDTNGAISLLSFLKS